MKVVYLNDSNLDYSKAELHFREAAVWARARCKSFVSYHVQDVSDVSYVYDNIAEYRFRDARDAVIFELKWS